MVGPMDRQCYHVFQKEGQKVNCNEILKISLFNLGFGLRTEGHLISDLTNEFLSDNFPYQPTKAS